MTSAPSTTISTGETQMDRTLETCRSVLRWGRGLAWVKAWRGALVLAIALLLSVAVHGQPNILLIVSDDQAWTDYGFMGHPEIRTPHLDRLARESLVFPRGYVPASLCCPSLASIITGRYPHEHRVVGNDPPRPAGMRAADYYGSDAYRAGRERLASYLEATPTLPRCLAGKGYRSFQSGKWWQGHYSRVVSRKA